MATYKTISNYNNGYMDVPVASPVMIYGNVPVFNQLVPQSPLVPSYGSVGYDVDRGNSYRGYYSLCSAYYPNQYGCGVACGQNDPADPCYVRKRRMTGESKRNADMVVQEINKNVFMEMQAEAIADAVNEIVYDIALPPFTVQMAKQRAALIFQNTKLSQTGRGNDTFPPKPKPLPPAPKRDTRFKIVWQQAMAEYIPVPMQ